MNLFSYERNKNIVGLCTFILLTVLLFNTTTYIFATSDTVKRPKKIRVKYIKKGLLNYDVRWSKVSDANSYEAIIKKKYKHKGKVWWHNTRVSTGYNSDPYTAAELKHCVLIKVKVRSRKVIDEYDFVRQTSANVAYSKWTKWHYFKRAKHSKKFKLVKKK